ncbi:eIF-2-alpha kinase GCN2 [Frankliniella fusca]|uniref:EIF-2-alpha kinase GCN2 n=1 Tax=Frankliniella fusca TaxID=407009 RepID=A0AAE1GSM7_9NEOP|nr:eIF-2-alpha kinase GCN2 [Frankliniella fusca]
MSSVNKASDLDECQQSSSQSHERCGSSSISIEFEEASSSEYKDELTKSGKQEKGGFAYSKYKDEFIETGKQEKGGFGYVEQVINKTDKQFYAIKRIPLKSSLVEDDENQRLIQEAKCLASLKHANVVRYFASWTEDWDEEYCTNDEYSSQDNSHNYSDSSSTQEKAQKSGHPYLFIQMELCTKTLRVVIDAFPRVLDTPDKVADYFFQILQGLKFLHQEHNICHRDLNPNNILLDAEERIKIGDFGLARLIEKCPALEENLLSSVGTELYRAPEIKSKKYDHRVDLYSCGIILFEMSYYMMTGTERIKVLDNLRDSSIVFPDSYKENTEDWQYDFAKSLLHHNPDERLTLDLMISSLSNHYPRLSNIKEEMSKAFSNPDSNLHKELMQEVFSQGARRSKGMRFDTPKPNLRESTSSRTLIQYIESVFCKHGACHLRTPLLTPCDLGTSKAETVVKLVTSDGIAVNLPHNARVDFARYVVWHEIPLLTRYDTLQTYRTECCSSSHPKPEYECVFDLVHTLDCNSDVKEADAQVLSVLIVLFKGIIQKENTTNFIAINHTDVVKSILLSVGVKEQFIAFALEKVGRNGFEDGLKCLSPSHIKEKGLDLDKLYRITSWSGRLKDIKQLVDEIIPKHKRQTERAIKYLHDVWVYSRDVISNSMDNVGISLKWCSNVHYYSGVLFTAVHIQEKKKDIILADGGRYDGILISYRGQLAEKKPGVEMIEQNGCGISVYVTKLLELKEDFFQPQLVVLTCPKNNEWEKNLYDFAKTLRLMGLNCRVEHYAKSFDIESYKADENVLCLVELLPSGEFNVTHKYTSLQSLENGQREVTLNVFYNANPPTLKLPGYQVLALFRSDMNMMQMNSLLVSAQMVV